MPTHPQGVFLPQNYRRFSAALGALIISMIAVSKTRVIGIAKRIPSTPPIFPPINSASKVIIGFNPTAFFITTGTIKLFSSC